MEHDRVTARALQELLVHLVPTECRAALVGFGLVAHAHPDICVDRMGTGDRVQRIARLPCGDAVLEEVAGGRTDHHLDTKRASDQRQRSRDVVAVSDVGDAEAFERPEALAERLEVGERLAGMMERGERVDHRDARCCGQRFDGVMRAGPDDHPLEVAGENAGGVADRLAPTELELVGAKGDGMPAELGDPDLKRHSGARRRPLEEQRDRPALERRRALSRAPSRLQLGRAIEKPLELRAAKLLTGEEVPSHGKRGMIRRMPTRVVSWNLFHGRDFPPDPALFTWRSRLLGRTERNATHLQVNRDLEAEFAGILAGREWDIALLQECPPRFAAGLERATGADSHRVLTARNWFQPLSSALGRRNPDLIASWEGGANLTLVRGHAVAERAETVLTRHPERRVMAMTRLESGLCVANLHASTSENDPEADIRLAAEAAVSFSGGGALIFGGDLNRRPAATTLFEELAERHGLRAPTAPDVIDHLLVRGLDVLEAPHQEPPEAREVIEEGRAVRLSDHAILDATFDSTG